MRARKARVCHRGRDDVFLKVPGVHPIQSLRDDVDDAELVAVEHGDQGHGGPGLPPGDDVDGNLDLEAGGHRGHGEGAVSPRSPLHGDGAYTEFRQIFTLLDEM